MGYFFALLSPFLDSTINYLDKYLISKYTVNTTVLAVYSGIIAFFTGLIIFLFIGLHFVDIKSAAIIVLSGFLSVFILVTYFKALKYGEASRVGSLFQFAPVMVLLLSLIFLNETLTIKQYIGCFFIIISGFLLSIKKIHSGVIKVNKDFWYMILSCFLVALSTVFFKLGAEEIGFWESLPYEGLGNGLAVLVVAYTGNHLRLLKKSQTQMPKKIFIYLIASELIYRLSRYLFYYALILLPASIVSVLQGFQPIFLVIEGIILSLWFPKIIREIITTRTIGIKFAAVTGIFIGLYSIFI